MEPPYISASKKSDLLEKMFLSSLEQFSSPPEGLLKFLLWALADFSFFC